MQSCRAGDGAAGRRLTISDARIGYRLSGCRPGLSLSFDGHQRELASKRLLGNAPPWPRLQPCTMNDGTDGVAALRQIVVMAGVGAT